MALSSNTVWEVRASGNDLNGGCFDSNLAPGIGIDYTLQHLPQATGSNLTVDSSISNNVIPDNYIVVSGDIGNVIQIPTGLIAFTGNFYQITGVTATGAGGQWRLDRSPAATGSSGGVWALGGALKSPSIAVAYSLNDQDIFWKYHTQPYVINRAESGVPSGLIEFPGLNMRKTLIGYDTTRTISNNDSNWPMVVASGITGLINLVGFAGASSSRHAFRNIIIDGKDLGVHGFSEGNSGSHVIENIYIKNCIKGFIIVDEYVANCIAENCAIGFENGSIFACGTKNCPTGFSLNLSTARNCIAWGSNQDGFKTSAFGAFFQQCVAYNCNDGFDAVSANIGTFVGCLAFNNSGAGFRLLSNHISYLRNCAAGANTVDVSGTSSVSLINPSVTSLSVNPFVDADNGNFALNNTPSGGAVLRNAGFPNTFIGPFSGTIAYTDIGAIRHQDPSGSVSVSGTQLPYFTNPYF